MTAKNTMYSIRLEEDLPSFEKNMKPKLRFQIESLGGKLLG